ncbi:MAG: IPT/TIG domain-containing protein [Acidobacteria bacterium]|nr:IPT/TIG domain-containing protein [Acidobacteriota bacterium]
MSAGTLPIAAQAPTNLVVKSATSRRIDLSWSGTASGYAVQRRSLGGTYSNLGTVTASTFSDTAIDAYTTYQYQVVANLAGGASSPSNQVTVGPPPSGFTTAAPPPGPAGSQITGNFGYNLSMCLDANGDPAIAYIFFDPNTDTNPSDTRIEFRSWNRAAYKWNDLVRVGGTNGDTTSAFHQTLSMAYDASISTWAIAAETIGPGDSQLLTMFTSTDGVTWTRRTVASGGLRPSLQLAGGNLYLAYVVEQAGLRYVTGKLSADPATWLTSNEVAVAGVAIARLDQTPSLAMDSAGNPGIAYWCDSADGSNTVLMYWRPAGSAAPVKIADTKNNQLGDPAVRLVYAGLNPRVLATIPYNDADFGVVLHSVRSDNGGAAWNPPVLIPPDGTSSTGWRFDLAVDSQGRGLAAYSQNSGSGDSVCGNPKVSRTSDFATWKTCDVVNDPKVTGAYNPIPIGLQVVYGGNDKLYMLWTDGDAGILMYREPPPGAAAGPNLSSVVNGATFQPGIVAGSWATITGANLSDVTRTWQDSDFDGNLLPTNLSGVQVKINNLDAPVYYISPTQINVEAPGNLSGSVSVQVIHNGVAGNTVTANAVASQPGLFTYTLGGKTYPSALFNGTYTIVGDPALYNQAAKVKAGDIIQLYATGLGASPAGNIIQAPITFSSPVTVTIGAGSVTASFAGLVGVGLFQINFTVPAGLADGDYPLAVKVNGVASQGGVILPVTH